MLGDRAGRVAGQADGEGQRQLAPGGLVEQPGGQARSNGMQLQFRYQSLKTKNESSIRGGWVVHAVLVADETPAVTAQVEELIPIRAIPRQPGHVVAEDDADLPQRDPGDEVLESLAPL